MDAATGVIHLRAFLEQTHQMHMERHRFRFTPDGSAQLVIIGEHGPGVARALATKCELPVIGRLIPPHIPSWWDDLILEADPAAFYVIMLGEVATAETSETARELGLRTVTIQALNFGGLHPDAMYLAKPPLSPPGLGGWHSALVWDGAANGEPMSACHDRFNVDAYEALGYFDRFEEDLQRIYARDIGCDAPMADLFAERIRYQPLMRNPRDGSPLLYDLYVEALSPLLGLRPSLRQARGSESGTSPVWPIMPEFARRHELGYTTPLLFGRETEAYTLEEFIRRCYDSYSWWSPASLRQLRERVWR
jgi:hypothetical protein